MLIVVRENIRFFKITKMNLVFFLIKLSFLISIFFRPGRQKRSTRDSQGLYTVRTCSLYIQADHKLYEHIKNKEGNNDPIRFDFLIFILYFSYCFAIF